MAKTFDTSKTPTTNTLLLKNLPKDVDHLTEILMQLRPLPTEMKSFGRRRALLIYNNEDEARAGLSQLQGLIVREREIKAILFYKDLAEEKENTAIKASRPQEPPSSCDGKRNLSKRSKSTQTNVHLAGMTAMPALSNFVRRLYACNADLDFNQPPPPYLRYAYPRITPEILDSISIALMSNTRFYTQVLHLMNRMNLEPPFGPRKQKFVPPGEPHETATQTEDVVVMSSKQPLASEEKMSTQQPLVSAMEKQSSEEESELETSADELEQGRKKIEAANKAKRKQPTSAFNEEQYKKKARLLLQATLLKKSKSTPLSKPKSTTTTSAPISALRDVFEAPTEVKSSKISLNLSTKKTAQPTTATKSIAATTGAGETLPAFEPPSDYSTQRLDYEELRLLPIYKNYTLGEPSSKLYIKNLSKDVSAEDLQALYKRFVPTEQLDIKVMQQGRMKGQAFVTFNNVAEEKLELVVGEALRETNGFMLKKKPMVVCYGRK